MKKLSIFIIIIGISLITACSNTDSAKDKEAKKADFLHLEDVDKDKAKKEIIQSALETNMLSRLDHDYTEDEIVNIEICETVHIDKPSADFDGKFMTYWETEDGDYSNYATMEDYTVDNVANYEPVEDRCMTLN